MHGLRTYERGMYEPGICALRSDYTALYSWALWPAAHNMGGALGRVKASDALKAVELSLSGDFSLVNWEPEYTLSPSEGGPSDNLLYVRRLLTKAMLLAEGNFVRPMGLELEHDGTGADGNSSGMQSHFQAKARLNALKLAAVATGLGLGLARRRTRAGTAAVLALYAAYFQAVCEPVYKQSWHTGSTGARPKALSGGQVLTVAGFASCPYHQRALSAARRLVDARAVERLEERTFDSRDEYRAWLLREEGGPRDALDAPEAKRHTSSPLVWSGESDYVGGCDALLELARHVPDISNL